MTASAAQRTLGRACSERALMDAIVEYAERRGWMVMHISDRAPDAERRDYRERERGFPDLVLVRSGELIFAELKTSRGKLRMEQCAWLTALGEVMFNAAEDAVSVCVWRPAQWLEGTIEARLR